MEPSGDTDHVIRLATLSEIEQVLCLWEEARGALRTSAFLVLG